MFNPKTIYDMKKIFIFSLLLGLLVGCSQITGDTGGSNKISIQAASILPTASAAPTTPPDNDIWLESLITKTPQEGRELAIKMARKTIGAIQKDPEVKKRLRGVYAEDAELLILSAEVVAIEFQTVAAANNYWRK